MALLLDREFAEHELAEKNELDLRNISTRVWPVVLSRCKAIELRLYNVKLSTLNGIEKLTKTRRLSLEWANKIESLEPVFRLKGLTHLKIVDFPNLHRLDGIETLSELTELRLSGNPGGGASPLRLDSIESVSRIPNLTRLSIANMKLETDDISSLARCSNLRYLSLTNQFQRTQIAFLAGKLNAQLAEPLTAHVKTHLRCVKCDAFTSMFTGRRMPFLCPVCDAPRFEKLTLQFEQMVVDASSAD
ncbi:leucine-rich repeat domain-containing protein [Pseudomonas folii]|uniref:Leucine-rich repeat domain-containing protein n=1 Tax=Pseudomonas folii TaxID=2762593 RepID=A0ABR7AV18_9PSED|nr:leucine-rich repeat domain-containing protein [Pseudomonas folii]MBC3948767.1 leucine-rich repeat domain-containing protein [Pseudomonas folii]